MKSCIFWKLLSILFYQNDIMKLFTENLSSILFSRLYIDKLVTFKYIFDYLTAPAVPLYYSFIYFLIKTENWLLRSLNFLIENSRNKIPTDEKGKSRDKLLLKHWVSNFHFVCGTIKSEYLMNRTWNLQGFCLGDFELKLQRHFYQKKVIGMWIEKKSKEKNKLERWEKYGRFCSV